MGLDVTLYRSPKATRQEELDKEEEAEKRTEAVYEEYAQGRSYEELSEEDFDKIGDGRKAIYKEMGLDEYGCSKVRKSIELHSKKYPNHMFKIGYLRSSYNSSGINHILRNLGMNDLYYIFGIDENNYYYDIDWEQSLIRVKEVIEQLSAHINSDLNKYRVESFSTFAPTEEFKNDAEILKYFVEELKSHEDGFTSYSNSVGTFMLKGINVKSVIFVKESGAFTDTAIKLVVENEDGRDNLKWYLESLEITQEMIEYVLSQDNPDDYILGWSA
jgi:hypothetical protein